MAPFHWHILPSVVRGTVLLWPLHRRRVVGQNRALLPLGGVGRRRAPRDRLHNSPHCQPDSIPAQRHPAPTPLSCRTRPDAGTDTGGVATCPARLWLGHPPRHAQRRGRSPGRRGFRGSAHLHRTVASPLFRPSPLTHHGHLIFDPRKAAAAITLQHSKDEYIKHFPPPDPDWSSTHLIDAIDNAALEPRAVYTTMLHRLLAAQRHPPGYGGVVCPYCHLAQSDITDHLLRRCPPFFLQYLSIAWRLLRHPQVFPLLSTSTGSSTLL